MKELKERKLTAKEKQFCLEYIKLNEGNQAAINAKYAPKSARITASKLLTKTNIQEEIKKLRSDQEKRTLVTADFVILGLKAVAERCMQAEQVLDKLGNPTGEYKFDSSGANTALKALGEHLNLFKLPAQDLYIHTFEQIAKQKSEYGFK
jgi:phage terminase small subunit